MSALDASYYVGGAGDLKSGHRVIVRSKAFGIRSMACSSTDQASICSILHDMHKLGAVIVFTRHMARTTLY